MTSVLHPQQGRAYICLSHFLPGMREMMEHYVYQHASVCERDREKERAPKRRIKHSSVIRHNLSGAMSQYHNISHFFHVSPIWQWEPSPQISGVISAWMLQDRDTVCNSTDGRGYSSGTRGITCKNVWYVLTQIKLTYSEALRRQYPWRNNLPSGSAVSLKSSLSCSMWKGETKHSAVCVPVLIKAVTWVLLDIGKTSTNRSGVWKRPSPSGWKKGHNSSSVRIKSISFKSLSEDSFPAAFIGGMSMLYYFCPHDGAEDKSPLHESWLIPTCMSKLTSNMRQHST